MNFVAGRFLHAAISIENPFRPQFNGETMKIREIRAAGLRGATPEGGWDEELRPDDCVHTLIAVITDEGPIGLGSVFTSDQLVKAALALLEPLYRGENAVEPERVSEKLHQNTFWLGRGGSVTHTISGIDIALWDLLARPPANQSVGSLEADIAIRSALCLLADGSTRSLRNA